MSSKKGAVHVVRTFRSLIVGCDASTEETLATTLEHVRLPPPELLHGVGKIAEVLKGADFDLVFFDSTRAQAVLACLPFTRSSTRFVLVGHSVSASAAFQYGRQGIDGWLDRDADVHTVLRCLQDVMRAPTALQRISAAHLGRYGLKDAQHSVRMSMIAEALRRTGGSRHAAAKLLGVDRRAVQLALKESDVGAEFASFAWGKGRRAQVDPTALEGRIYRPAGRLVVWHELAVQSVSSIDTAFEIITSFADRPVDLVIDLTEASYPSGEVRERLRNHFVEIRGLNSVAIAVGGDPTLGLAARVVLSDAQRCPVSLHSSCESAIRMAEQTELRRGA